MPPPGSAGPWLAVVALALASAAACSAAADTDPAWEVGARARARARMRMRMRVRVRVRARLRSLSARGRAALGAAWRRGCWPTCPSHAVQVVHALEGVGLGETARPATGWDSISVSAEQEFAAACDLLGVAQCAVRVCVRTCACMCVCARMHACVYACPRACIPPPRGRGGRRSRVAFLRASGPCCLAGRVRIFRILMYPNLYPQWPMLQYGEV